MSKHHQIALLAGLGLTAAPLCARLYFVYIGIARLACTYLYSTTLTYVALRLTRNLRYTFLKAALSQEIGFFDQGTAGSIAMQATSNGKLVQNAVGVGKWAVIVGDGDGTRRAASVDALTTVVDFSKLRTGNTPCATSARGLVSITTRPILEHAVGGFAEIISFSTPSLDHD